MPLGPDTCHRCPALAASRTRIVNGTGPTDADIVIVGEAPGDREDARGTPFIGRSGTVLTRTLNAHGISRTDVRITNTVRCHPPDNRDPTSTERDACADYLVEEIVTVDPSVIVAVGSTPTATLVGDVSVTDAAGDFRTVTIGQEEFDVLVSVHPAATLYDSSLEPVFDATFNRLAERTGYAPSTQTRVTEY